MCHPRTALRAALRLLGGLTLVAATVLFAQETRGTITGRVFDPTSAAVAGAKVTVENTDTNVVTRIASNEDGYYEAPLLVAGNYQVEAEAQGFRKALTGCRRASATCWRAATRYR